MRSPVPPSPCGARKMLQAYAYLCIFRPLRKLRPRFFCHWQREAAIPPEGEARAGDREGRPYGGRSYRPAATFPPRGKQERRRGHLREDGKGKWRATARVAPTGERGTSSGAARHLSTLRCAGKALDDTPRAKARGVFFDSGLLIDTGFLIIILPDTKPSFVYAVKQVGQGTVPCPGKRRCDEDHSVVFEFLVLRFERTRGLVSFPADGTVAASKPSPRTGKVASAVSRPKGLASRRKADDG